MAQRHPLDLIAFLGASLGWAWSRGRVQFQLIAILQASSRVSYTVAMFLPIKILILTTESGGPPAYFAALAPYLHYEVFLALLIASVPLVYAYSVGGKILSARLLAVGKKGAGESKDAPWPGVQHKRLAGLYERSVRIGEDAVVMALCLIGILVCDWRLALLCLLLVVLHFALAEAFAPAETKGATPLITAAHVNELSGSAAFLLAFGGVVGLVAWGNANLFFAILGLLLARLLFQGSQRILNEIDRLGRDFAQEITAARAALPATREGSTPRVD